MEDGGFRHSVSNACGEVNTLATSQGRSEGVGNFSMSGSTVAGIHPHWVAAKMK